MFQIVSRVKRRELFKDVHSRSVSPCLSIRLHSTTMMQTKLEDLAKEKNIKDMNDWYTLSSKVVTYDNFNDLIN